MRTRVGYAGGTRARPTYHDLGDHSEAIEVVYDPAVISYEKLLVLFWEQHDPRRGTGSRQYRAERALRVLIQRRLQEMKARVGPPGYDSTAGPRCLRLPPAGPAGQCSSVPMAFCCTP